VVVSQGRDGTWAIEAEVARSAVREASRAILRTYERADARVYTKADASPVTDADLASDRIIREWIGGRFPDDALLTEEGADDPARLASARCWIADPIDGTQQFVDRTGEFDVFLALVVAGRPVVGVACHPPSGQLLWAIEGQGAWVEDAGAARPLRVAPPADDEPARLATGRYHGAPANLPILTRAARRAGTRPPENSPYGFQPRSLTAGSDGQPRYHLFVGLGQDADGPNPAGGEWDFAAPDLIVREAGGAFTDVRGRRFAYNKPDARNFGGLVAATDPALHERFLAALGAELPPAG
jgi:3'-phosphoadenosine 5'-phosphosulfate (PAPS) 3'-phosphatase